MAGEEGEDVDEGVKHLNPRQGITTSDEVEIRSIVAQGRCETPKSPPGDYNSWVGCRTIAARLTRSVKHLNPRQGITTLVILVDLSGLE